MNLQAYRSKVMDTFLPLWNEHGFHIVSEGETNSSRVLWVDADGECCRFSFTVEGGFILEGHPLGDYSGDVFSIRTLIMFVTPADKRPSDWFKHFIATPDLPDIDRPAPVYRTP